MCGWYRGVWVVARRNLIIPIIVLGQMAVILFASHYVLDSPLSGPTQAEPFSYVRERSLSDPAMAGLIRFGNHCAACHGTSAEGTDRAPGLLDRTFAEDFRDSELFHSALGRAIPAHRSMMQALSEPGSLDFNMIEKMGKFLREARRTRVQ